jgi:TRAP-type C4-dicarboxylate transport system permease small subunit
VDQGAQGAEALANQPPKFRDRVRSAWRESKPPEYDAEKDSVGDVVTGKIGMIARAQEGIASVFFFATFATVLTEVLLRLFGHPVVWAIELPTYLFIWTFCIAAGLSDWTDRHLAFDLVADKLPPAVKHVIDIFLNLLFIAVFAAAIPGSISFLQYSATQPSSGLPFSQAWGYAAIVLLFASAVLLRGRLLLRQLRRPLRSRYAGSAAEEI